MKKSLMSRSRCLLSVVLVIIVTSTVQACNVPVFRFALERWRPDAYRLTVFHQGALSDEQQSKLNELDERERQGALNLIVRTVDVARLVESERVLLEKRLDRPLPAMVLQYPSALRITEPLVTAAFDDASLQRLTTSVVGQEVVQRLVAGQTAVWLLLESGDKAKDDSATTLLTQQVTQLARELKLPELTDASDDKLQATTPLKVEFSVLRLSRSAIEHPLIQQLVHSEPDLAERTDPMVFPIFGRGRALFPLIGAGITADNIRDSASFLVGACSCEIKEQNPGFDLLISADWDDLLSQSGVPLMAEQRLRSSPDGDAEMVPIPAGSSAFHQPALRLSRRLRWSVIALVIGLTLCVGRRVLSNG